MADELELVAVNEDDDGWVDSTPDAVSTGYGNQNTASQATWNGFDRSSCKINGANLEIDPSGIIDDGGLPFVVKTQIVLTLPVSGLKHFLKVVAGSTSILREIEFTTDRGTYNALKNAYYNGSGERILNWVYFYPGDKVYKISGYLPTADLNFPSFVEINSGTTFTNSGALTTPLKYTNWTAPTHDLISEYSAGRITLKQDGVYNVKLRFELPDVGTGNTMTLSLYKNGVQLPQSIYLLQNIVLGPDYCEVNINIKLNATDYLEVYVQSSVASVLSWKGRHWSVEKSHKVTF